MKTYRIHLIRHGEIAASNSGKYIGVTDLPLSERGKAELKKLDLDNKYPYAAALFSSPLKRCVETAGILYPEMKPIIIDDLRECDFGDWEQKTAEQIEDDDVFKAWLAGDTSVKPPNGESAAALTRRVCLAFESIVQGLLKSGITDCIIITHGGIISTLLSVYGLPQAKPFEWITDSGCGFSLRVSTMLWQRDKVAEVYSRLPVERDDD